MTPLQVLKKYFGFESFRPGQREIVEAVISGCDTLALLATGGGKSICFQVPGLVLGGTTIVISPLISLMKDQVDALVRKGIQATFINSALSEDDQNTRLEYFKRGEYDFVYLSPEKLRTNQVVEIAKHISLKLLVVDEAHCISEWGHDFRPDYRELHEFTKKLPTRPIIMAVTATATQQVRNDICQVLHLKSPQIFVNTFQRTNLSFFVIPCLTQSSQILMLMRLLHNHQGEAGIIYAATREMTERLASLIQQFDFRQQFSVKAYHGGISNEERSQIQEEFIKNKVQIITATNAFGMGVDKSNVRFVIHYQFPASLEHYYQEAGRAGRDQVAAKCYLLFNSATTQIHATFIRGSSSKTRQKINQQKLQAVIQYARRRYCRTQALLAYFDEKIAIQNCESCDVCLNSEWQLSSAQHLYFEKLTLWQHQLCQKFGLQPTQILTQDVLHYLTILQPQTTAQLVRIPGLGRGWRQKWEHQFVAHFFSTKPLKTDTTPHQ